MILLTCVHLNEHIYKIETIETNSQRFQVMERTETFKNSHVLNVFEDLREMNVRSLETVGKNKTEILILTTTQILCLYSN